MFTQFSGNSKQRQINLGNRPSSFGSGPSNSQDLLVKARAERQARERSRLESTSALVVQRVWRGRRVAGRVREELLREVEAGIGEGMEGVKRQGRALMVILWNRRVTGLDAKVEAALNRWCESAVLSQQDGTPKALLPIASDPSHTIVILTLMRRMLKLISISSSTPTRITYLRALLILLKPQSYLFLDRQLAFERDKIGFLGSLPQDRALSAGIAQLLLERLICEPAGWVESLVGALKSIPTGQKKHPALPLIIELLILPSKLYPKVPLVEDRIYPSMFSTLLTVPNLTGIVPISSLRDLITGLALWDRLIPLGSGLYPNAIDLNAGGLATEIGKTEALANLATLVVRSGTVEKQNQTSLREWMMVLARLLSGLEDQWGMWIEGRGIWSGEEDEDDEMNGLGKPSEGVDLDSDEEEEEPAEVKALVQATKSSAQARRAKVKARGKVAASTVTKLNHIFAMEHINTLIGAVMRHESLILPLSGLIQSILRAFRGSPTWESLLDGMLDGQHAARFERDLWRLARGLRVDSKGSWEGLFTAQDRGRAGQLSALSLLSNLYLQNLLTLPDDEFFNPIHSNNNGRNAFSLDEVRALAAMWRNLAYWGYMAGVGSNSSETDKLKEEVRGLTTQGVLAISARNARRPFLSQEFWHMISPRELPTFIDAVIVEERQANLADGEDTSAMDIDEANMTAATPPWLRARRLLSKRQMARISPRLGILNNLPMTLPFESRVEVLQEFIYNDSEKLGIDRYMARRGLRHEATIRRTHLSEDSFRALNNLGSILKGTIQIKFIDEWGNPEAGIDGGGLFKEWLTSLSKEIFDTDRGLWLSTARNELYPNPHSYAKEPRQLEWFTFIGRMLGKALYEGILVNASFAGFFLAKWLGRQSYLDDLASLDYDLYKGLVSLKNYSGDPEDLALTFTITEDNFGVITSYDLKKDGSNIPVTKANRTEYIQMVCDYKLNKQIGPQCEAFFSGLSDIIDAKWLRMFDQQELQTLIGGSSAAIDVDDLEQNTIMHDNPGDEAYHLFWKVVHGLSQTELKALLKFVTSTPNPPLLGFKYLHPKFGIRLAGTDTTRLPSASSCMNLLKLPKYRDEYTLKAKLLQAINSNAGFDLS